MKIKLIQFNNVKSTNDVAIRFIKKKKFKPTLISSKTNERKRHCGKKMDVTKRKFIYVSVKWSKD